MRKKKQDKNSFKIILISALTALLLLAAIFSVYIYKDLKRVEQSVYNIYQEIKTTNGKIEKYSALDEQSAQNTVKFTEATKNWQIYQNDDFHFQMKSPASWGQFNFNLRNVDAEDNVIYSMGKFHLLGESPFLQLELANYDFNQEGFKPLSSQSLFQTVLRNQTTECENQVFDDLKQLNVGEVRNCYVRENILNQKFLIFRLVNETTGSLLAVYPRENYYLKVDLPDEINAEVDYFIQSLVFLQ
jgi:hypothetical protein